MLRTRTVHVAMAIAAAALISLAAAGPAGAQAAPYTAYGTGLEPGQVVEAFIDGASCGSAAVSGEGNWLLSIPSTAPCSPSAGDTITFTLDGRATAATEIWHAGGAPADIANGTALAVSEDTTPPVLTAPSDITVTIAATAPSAPASGSAIAGFLAAASAVDQVDGAIAVQHDAPSSFPLGATVVTFSATDAAGNTATSEATVTVERATADAGPGTFAAPVGQSGIQLGVWNGGTVEQVSEATGGRAYSIWAFTGGEAIGYTVGAPPFVNARFLALFPDGFIPANEILVLVLP